MLIISSPEFGHLFFLFDTLAERDPLAISIPEIIGKCWILVGISMSFGCFFQNMVCFFRSNMLYIKTKSIPVIWRVPSFFDIQSPHPTIANEKLFLVDFVGSKQIPWGCKSTPRLPVGIPLIGILRTASRLWHSHYYECSNPAGGDCILGGKDLRICLRKRK